MAAATKPPNLIESQDNDFIWDKIREEVETAAANEPTLARFLHTTILHHKELESALSYLLASQLGDVTVTTMMLQEVILAAFSDDNDIRHAIRQDLKAVLKRDSACREYHIPFLYFKGFHALQTYRVAHSLWRQGRHSLALFLQSRMSQKFGVDIHPAARFGHSIMFDHATGLVVGETAVVGNKVSILQSVTLGGTGKEDGDRHPKVEDGVLISAGAKILGNIRIGEGAKVGAGSVVLCDVPPHTTVVGVPARIVGKPTSRLPALDMDHAIPDGKW